MNFDNFMSPMLEYLKWRNFVSPSSHASVWHSQCSWSFPNKMQRRDKTLSCSVQPRLFKTHLLRKLIPALKTCRYEVAASWIIVSIEIRQFDVSLVKWTPVVKKSGIAVFGCGRTNSHCGIEIYICPIGHVSRHWPGDRVRFDHEIS